MIGQISEMWPHGPHRSSWRCFNSIPHGGGGGCCATIYSYSIRVVREAEKWQSFRSMVRNRAGVLTHKVVFMRRDQLRMALGCPKLLLFIRETISSQEVRIVTSWELRPYLSDAILGYPEPLWSLGTLGCAIFNMTPLLCLKFSLHIPGFHFPICQG